MAGTLYMQKVRLGDIAILINGDRGKNYPSQADITNDGEVPFVNAGHLNGREIAFDEMNYISKDKYEKLSSGKFQEGDILYCLRGSIGKKAIVSTDIKGAIASSLVIIRPNSEKLYGEYLMLALESPAIKEQLTKANNGSSQPNLSAASVREYEIELPELLIQREVVEKLVKVRDIIDNRRQELQLLDDLIKARFVEMFGMPGTDAFGWGLVQLGSACNINPKKSLDSRLVSGAEVSFVPMPAVTEHGEIDATAIKEYDEVKTGFTYFAEKDVLFAKITPCMENGKGAVAKGLHNGVGFGSTEFHVLRPISGKTDPYWIYTLTAFPQFRMDAANNMTGSAGQRRVPASFLENYRVSLPPIDLQNQFAAFVYQVDKSKVKVQKSLDETQCLFDSLMQKYFG